MEVEVVIPEFSESISEGTVGDWLKNVGDQVIADETLVEIETDKVVLEIPSPVSGELKVINSNVNDTVASGDVIAVIESTQATSPKEDNKESLQEVTSPDQLGKVEEIKQAPANEDLTPKTSPAVRKLLDEHGLDKHNVTPTGKHGRITKADVMRAVEESPQVMSSPSTGSEMNSSAGLTERVPMSSLRKRIAQRLVSAQNDYAMLTTFNEVNMQEILAIRAKHNDKFEEMHGVKLGFMSFFVLAAVEALREYPAVNASIEEDDIVYHRYMDVGIAVSSERGLVVPIVRNADAKSMSDIEVEIGQLASKARENKLTIDNLTGGTFTITNGGVFGSMMSTPIVNPPQSAILGMHAIEKRPVVENDEVVIRPMMYLALSYDHRIIDGREAVLFLSHIKKIIEDPVQLLLYL